MAALLGSSVGLLKPTVKHAPVCAKASLRAHSNFSGVRVASSPRRIQQQRIERRVQAMALAYPENVEQVREEFPDKGVANYEEGRALIADGYTYLDVRSALEIEDIGKVAVAVNVPLVICKKKYDAEQGKKVVIREDNPNFLAQIKKRFPDPETKLLVVCSNGKSLTMDALMALDEAGYTNIVGLRGGYYTWFRVFDAKLNRRRNGEYAETYNHDGDSCGIHSSGAGFDNLNKEDKWVPPASLY